MDSPLEQVCELRGSYAIEASARRHAEAGAWHPELKLTRAIAPGMDGPCQSFAGMKPLFENARGAVQYAVDLGRALVDENSSLLKI